MLPGRAPRPPRNKRKGTPLNPPLGMGDGLGRLRRDGARLDGARQRRGTTIVGTRGTAVIHRGCDAGWGPGGPVRPDLGV